MGGTASHSGDGQLRALGPQAHSADDEQVPRPAFASPGSSASSSSSSLAPIKGLSSISTAETTEGTTQPDENESSELETSRPLAECPLCYATTHDVEQLPHKNSSGNLSDHQACRNCREELVNRNAKCPWCRTEMVWQTVFGVLDGLKGAARGFQDGQHDDLANLMSMWQEYEMCRTQSDICLFAREMAADPAVVARLEGALASANGWLRDSAGLWIRFYALYADGEAQMSPADGERLRRVVDSAIDGFERDHGGHPDFVGAMYQQSIVAVLSASFSGMSTQTVSILAKRVGEAALRVYRRHYGKAPRTVAKVRERLNRDYAEAVSSIVWGSAEDPILKTFFRYV